MRLPRALPLTLAVLALSGCLRSVRRTCAIGECGMNAACVAGRCEPTGATPAIATANRIVIAADDLAVVNDSDGPIFPSSIVLGPHARLFLKFRVPRSARVIEAFLLLSRERRIPIAGSGTLRVSAVEAWDSRTISRKRAPMSGAPLGRASVLSAVDLLRVDLLQAVRISEESGEKVSLVVETEGGETSGIPVALVGSETTRPPLLELYIKGLN